MVLLFIAAIIMLPFTIYSIIKKPKVPTSPEFDKVEREINEWLRTVTLQASEESSRKVTKFSYINRKKDMEPLDFIYIPVFTKSINIMPSIKGLGTAILPESQLGDIDEPRDSIDTADEIRQLDKLIPLSR